MQLPMGVEGIDFLVRSRSEGFIVDTLSVSVQRPRGERLLISKKRLRGDHFHGTRSYSAIAAAVGSRHLGSHQTLSSPRATPLPCPLLPFTPSPIPA